MILVYTERDSKIGRWQEGALNLIQAKPTSKQLNLNKLGDADGIKVSGWPTQPEPILESRAVYNHHAHLVSTNCQLTLDKEETFIRVCKAELKTHLNQFPKTLILMREFIDKLSQRNGVPICSRKIYDLANKLMRSKTYFH